jgi:L,D-transpeptidase catalytic domain
MQTERENLNAVSFDRRRATSDASARLVCPGDAVLALQRQAGNAAVARLLSSLPGPTGGLTVGRACCPSCAHGDSCDDDDPLMETHGVLRRLARQSEYSDDGSSPSSSESVEGEALAGVDAEFGEFDALDGEFPAGGPILPIPSTPDDLDPGESAVRDVEEVDQKEEPVLAKSEAIIARTRKHHPVPSTLPRWITSIQINLERQRITINWSDGSPSQSGDVSSGRGRPCTQNDPCASQNERNCTPTGTFHPHFRGDASYTNSAGERMDWYVDLHVLASDGTDRGIGIHDGQTVTGRPRSHGCIRVHPGMAETINRNVTRVTLVTISGKAPTRPWRNNTCPRAQRSRR